MAQARAIHRLNHRQVVGAKPGTVLGDGGGLELRVDDSGARRWVMRVSVDGKRVNRGLGGFPEVSLQDARHKAAAIREAAKSGGVVEKQKAAARRAEIADGLTFRQMFERFWQDKRKTLGNGKHVYQWEATMTSYVFPFIGDRDVADVRPPEVLDVLRPIWHTKPVTAGRVLQRMAAVFDAAIVEEIRERANPCAGVSKRLGPTGHVVVHHPSLPYKDVPKFLVDLEASRAGLAIKLVLRFAVLTAVRSGEARGARWAEVDLAERVWTIPGERMKAGVTHLVPLSDQALAVLEQARTLGGADLVFPSPVKQQVLSTMAPIMALRRMGYSGDMATMHGFRTSLRMWAAEVLKVPDRVGETMLAHTDENKVRAAYLRSDFFEERRDVMRLWGEYVSRGGS